MSNKKPGNQEFRNFTSGIFYSLCIALVLFMVTVILLRVGPEVPRLLDFERWSGVSDAINLIIGLPIAFAAPTWPSPSPGAPRICPSGSSPSRITSTTSSCMSS